ncbi:hypothetical protein [Comamonas jiangduensis]|uniref:hypothetical protein n=1 Tax=Comamonas jiangduensis TaxID=1194168 RepID=UPI00158261BF|nr:hypothetical protein [Comamonas jiangduensis]
MANKMYPKGAEKLLGAQINFATDTIKAALVPSGYTFSNAHEYAADLGALVGPSVELEGKSIAGGVFDASDVSFGALAGGSAVKALVLFKDSGSAATSPLIAYYDEVVGFPFNTNGGAVSIPWSDGALKIISLVA